MTVYWNDAKYEHPSSTGDEILVKRDGEILYGKYVGRVGWSKSQSWVRYLLEIKGNEVYAFAQNDFLCDGDKWMLVKDFKEKPSVCIPDEYLKELAQKLVNLLGTDEVRANSAIEQRRIIYDHLPKWELDEFSKEEPYIKHIAYMDGSVKTYLCHEGYRIDIDELHKWLPKSDCCGMPEEFCKW